MLAKKLKALKEDVVQWNRRELGNVERQKKQLLEELTKLDAKEGDLGLTDGEKWHRADLRSQVKHLLFLEEISWRQKSRMLCIKEGDNNTKFFHKTTVQRRMHNNIPFLQNQEGAKVEEHKEIEQTLLNHFQQVHREQATDRQQAIGKITSNIPKLVTEEQNELLMRPIQPQEVDAAMVQLKEGKAPWPRWIHNHVFSCFLGYD